MFILLIYSKKVLNKFIYYRIFASLLESEMVFNGVICMKNYDYLDNNSLFYKNLRQFRILMLIFVASFKHTINKHNFKQVNFL